MFCQEHQTAFFKKGKMKNYAHMIKDENGEDTGEWCNAPAGFAEETATSTDNMSKEEWADKDTRTRHSIEGQKAADLTTQLWIAEKLKDNDTRVEALLSWLLIAIKQNMPDKVEIVVETNKPFGGEDIKALLNNAKITQKQASEILTEKFKITKQSSVMKMIEGLDKVQLKWFMDEITRHLGIPPEDIPF